MPLAYLKKQKRGSIMIMVVIVIPVLLGILSLAVDLGNVFLVRSQMQNAADAASLAAAGRLRSGTTAGQIAIAKTAAVNIANLNGFPIGAATTIVVAIPPGPSPDGSTATYAANPLYARVTVTHNVPLVLWRYRGHIERTADQAGGGRIVSGTALYDRPKDIERRLAGGW